MSDIPLLSPSATAQLAQLTATRRVSGLAYSGGKLSLAGWKHPAVVDLAGLAIPEQVPLLANHENRTASRLGLMRARVAGGPVLSLMVDGEIVSTSNTAEGVLEQARAGSAWQLSIGADPMEKTLVESGSRVVNGQTHTAPFFLVSRATLMEVSVVPVGADTATHLGIAATYVVSDAPVVGGAPDREAAEANLRAGYLAGLGRAGR